MIVLDDRFAKKQVNFICSLVSHPKKIGKDPSEPMRKIIYLSEEKIRKLFRGHLFKFV